jgi:hypothetical protein
MEEKPIDKFSICGAGIIMMVMMRKARNPIGVQS